MINNQITLWLVALVEHAQADRPPRRSSKGQVVIFNDAFRAVIALSAWMEFERSSQQDWQA